MYLCGAPCSVGKKAHKRLVKGKFLDKRNNHQEEGADKINKRSKETRIPFRDLKLPVKLHFKALCLTERHLKSYHGWVDTKKAASEDMKKLSDEKKAVKSLDNSASRFILDICHGSHSIIQGSAFHSYLKSYGEFCLKFQKNPIQHNLLR